MKLIKNFYTCSTHAINPDSSFSFCGLIGEYWFDCDIKRGAIFEESGDTVTCKTCKKLMQKYIIKKLKEQ